MGDVSRTKLLLTKTYPRPAMKVFPLLIAFALGATGIAAQAAPNRAARKRALRALCPIAESAGGPWGDDNLTAAIANINGGPNPANWPENAQETAYKTCRYGGYLV